MAVGEFTQYVSVFIASLTGAVSGYFYFNSPENLRIKLERSGFKLLRPSDPLWMYGRILRQKGTSLKSDLEKISSLKDVIKDDYSEITNGGNTLPNESHAYKLLLSCSRALSEGK